MRVCVHVRACLARAKDERVGLASLAHRGLALQTKRGGGDRRKAIGEMRRFQQGDTQRCRLTAAGPYLHCASAVQHSQVGKRERRN